MDGWYLHGKFFFSSSDDSIRIKGLRKRARASIAYFEGERFPHQRARSCRAHVQGSNIVNRQALR
jgi:hypothetical protein